jgi:hypothetical protein
MPKSESISTVSATTVPSQFIATVVVVARVDLAKRFGFSLRSSLLDILTPSDCILRQLDSVRRGDLVGLPAAALGDVVRLRLMGPGPVRSRASQPQHASRTTRWHVRRSSR